MYRDDHVFQCDIAKYYKISAAMVSRLVVEAQRDPKKIKALKVKKEDGQEVGDAVQKVVTDMLVKGVPIVKAEVVVEQVRRREDIEVSISQVKTIMKDNLGLGYRIARKIPIQANMERCLVLR